LRVNYPKGILLGILMSLTVVGLLLLKYYRSLRVILFYTKLKRNQLEEATDIYVVSEDKNEEICDVQNAVLGDTFTQTF
jgi:hypothetical protein